MAVGLRCWSALRYTGVRSGIHFTMLHEVLIGKDGNNHEGKCGEHSIRKSTVVRMGLRTASFFGPMDEGIVDTT